MRSWRSMPLPDSPVEAPMPLRMPLTHNFDQRSPHRFVVGLTVSTVAIIAASSSRRGVMRPWTSPTR